MAIATPRGASDVELVARVRAGDDSAFEELYRRYSRRIGAFVYGYVRDEGRAEDVTQEAFLSALRRLRETDSEIAFRPWIYEIARNAAIDLHRRNSRAEEVSINGDTPLTPADSRHLVGSVAPENALVDKERLDHLSGAFAELSETHHRILVLRELEGLSYREIGERMELTAPAVESTLFRARRRLEKEYMDLDTGRRCASMRLVIARLSEGVDLPRERRRLARHAVRCSHCRKRARELGVEPTGARVVARAAALFPLPVLLRRRGGSLPDAVGPAAEGSGMLLGKAGALLAAAALAGGGGATLGGYGPLAPDAGGHGTVAPVPAGKQDTLRAPPRERRPASTPRRATGTASPQGATSPGAGGGVQGPVLSDAPTEAPRQAAPPDGRTEAPPEAAPPDAGAPPIDPQVPALPPLQQPPPSQEWAEPESKALEKPELKEILPAPTQALEPATTPAVPSLPPIG